MAEYATEVAKYGTVDAGDAGRVVNQGGIEDLIDVAKTHQLNEKVQVYCIIFIKKLMLNIIIDA